MYRTHGLRSPYAEGAVHEGWQVIYQITCQDNLRRKSIRLSRCMLSVPSWTAPCALGLLRKWVTYSPGLLFFRLCPPPHLSQANLIQKALKSNPPLPAWEEEVISDVDSGPPRCSCIEEVIAVGYCGQPCSVDGILGHGVGQFAGASCEYGIQTA